MTGRTKSWVGSGGEVWGLFWSDTPGGLRQREGISKEIHEGCKALGMLKHACLVLQRSQCESMHFRNHHTVCETDWSSACHTDGQGLATGALEKWQERRLIPSGNTPCVRSDLYFLCLYRSLMRMISSSLFWYGEPL